jgi:hypothetical protein
MGQWSASHPVEGGDASPVLELGGPGRVPVLGASALTATHR